MVKYVAVNLALKCFSSAGATRRLYRALGNRFGGRRRTEGAIPAYYPDRVKRMLRLAKQYGVIRDGDRVLELGTGWMHWEALTLRLFFDITAVLYDVWDNRQLRALKNYLRQFQSMLNADLGLSAAEVQRAQGLIDEILKVESFEQLYALLGFQYVVESSGSLASFADDSFNLVVSGAVLEHVNRDALPTLARETYRILKPGGWAVHSIDTSDHLSHYDSSVSKKKYVSFSETTWRLLCNNEVQYINRVQRGEWLDLFKTGGFELVEEELREVDISHLKIASRFANMDRRDLATTVVRLTLRKPGGAGQGSAV
jgi:SAM-dependent methyltransferase